MYWIKVSPLLIIYETIFIGLDAILDENRLEDLALIFTLVSRVKDGQVMLKAGFSNYIKVFDTLFVFNIIV